MSPNKFQNELMTSHLSQATGIVCQAAESLSDFAGLFHGNGLRQGIVLCDCMRRDPRKLLSAWGRVSKSMFPETRIGLFSVGRDETGKTTAIASKVNALFFDHDPMDRIIQGVLAMLNGEVWPPKEVVAGRARASHERNGNPGLPNEPLALTKREREVLVEIRRGASTQAIADSLGISRRTLKVHFYNIYKKINVSTRVQAALWAERHLGRSA